MLQLAEAVKNEIDVKFIEWADDFGEQLNKGGLTTSQIRSIFGIVKKMEQSSLDIQQFLLLRAQIAYAAKRANKRGLYDLEKQLKEAITVVAEEKDPKRQNEYFKRFCKGFEAILAYYRAHGGK